MHRRWNPRSLWLAALLVFALVIPLAALGGAQQPDGEGNQKARRPRLPNYYAQVTTQTQQARLRAVLKEFAPQIRQKREELQALIDKRDAALDEMLTVEQRQEIAKLRADAAARRKAASTKKAAARRDKAKKAS